MVQILNQVKRRGLNPKTVKCNVSRNAVWSICEVVGHVEQPAALILTVSADGISKSPDADTCIVLSDTDDTSSDLGDGGLTDSTQPYTSTSTSTSIDTSTDAANVSNTPFDTGTESETSSAGGSSGSDTLDGTGIGTGTCAGAGCGNTDEPITIDSSDSENQG